MFEFLLKTHFLPNKQQTYQNFVFRLKIFIRFKVVLGKPISDPNKS